MSLVLARVARWAFTHRWRVLAAWLVVAVAAVVLAQASNGKTNDDFTIPGTEAQHVSDLLSQKVPQLSGGQMQVLIKAPTGETLSADKAEVDAATKRLAGIPGVSSAQSPYAADLVSRDGTIGMAMVQFDQVPADVPDATLDQVNAVVAPLRADGFQVAYTGSVYPGWNTAPSELPELIGLVIAFIILLLTFGSLVAAGMPIVSAIVGVVVTSMGITAAASVLTIASASTTVALMLGLSCGIDYGLFLISRYRANVLAGMSLLDAVGLAAGTAGSAVVFAGLTVIVALCGLCVVGIPFLAVMGLSAACSVLVALLIALSLVPAVLGFAGERVLPRRMRGSAEEVLAAREAASAGADSGRGSRWARFVVRRRVPVAVGGILLLGIIAIPATQIHLGLPSGASEPTSNTQRQAYDLTTEAFGAGFNGALLVTADPVGSKSDASAIDHRLSQVPGVVSATSLVLQNGTAVFQVVPTSGPADQATKDLVNRLRDERSALAAGTGAQVLVGGATASNIDVSAKLASALPIFLIVVVGLALVLLTFAFRTLLVPLKSVLGFLLSVAAAFGAEVAVFQWGWGEHLLGIPKSETVSFLPIIMLAIIFGLSSDYEVFVVSRIKEEFSLTDDARGAVVTGTAHAARVVTAAALIMFSIFVAFMLNSNPTIRAIGFSFAVGVFLDAFVVRLTVVPAIMAIVGSRMWWHPRWFERYVPDPDIEGARLEREYAGS
jgi:putative drug exporter of the RND superfamily